MDLPTVGMDRRDVYSPSNLPILLTKASRGGFPMFDRDDRYHEDPLAVGRGLAFGLLIGTLMWAGIIGGIMYILYR